MDPVSTIISALVSGIAAGAASAASQTVQVAYTYLRNLIVGRHGRKGGLGSAIKRAEQSPDAPGRIGKVEEKLAQAGIGNDQQLLDAANGLLQALAESRSGAGSNYEARMYGSNQANAQGPYASANIYGPGSRIVQPRDGGIVVDGDMNGSNIVTGHGNIVNGKKH